MFDFTGHFIEQVIVNLVSPPVCWFAFSQRRLTFFAVIYVQVDYRHRIVMGSGNCKVPARN